MVIWPTAGRKWWDLIKAGEMLAILDTFVASEQARNGASNTSTAEKQRLKRFEAAFDGRKISEATMKRILYDHQSLSDEQRNLYSNEKAKEPFSKVRASVRPLSRRGVERQTRRETL